MTNVMSDFIQQTLDMVGLLASTIRAKGSQTELQEWEERCRQFRPHLEWIASSDNSDPDSREAAEDALILIESLLSGKSSDG